MCVCVVHIYTLLDKQQLYSFPGKLTRSRITFNVNICVLSCYLRVELTEINSCSSCCSTSFYQMASEAHIQAPINPLAGITPRSAACLTPLLLPTWVFLLSQSFFYHCAAATPSGGAHSCDIELKDGVRTDKTLN